MSGLDVLVWHVHGSYATSFVQGPHRYLVPVLPDRSADGRGRARSWDWPATAVEVTPDELADAPIDVVVCQRPVELHDLVQRWTGRRPGVDLPTVYLEHNTPPALRPPTPHPAADRDDLTAVHVTGFNRLVWDLGSTPTRVVEHGIVDPGHRYTGELDAAAAVVNEPARRGRIVGADLLTRWAEDVPVHLFGMGASCLPGPPGLTAVDDLPQPRLHDELARRRCYVHPYRWTSLGLALIEAMALGMPVVALGTTAVPDALGSVGTWTVDPDAVTASVRELLRDPEAAAAQGRRSRERAIERFGLGRFLAEWDRTLEEVVDGHRRRTRL